MKNKLYQNLETIATISWLGMDFCWMSKYSFLAWALSFFAISFSLGSIFTFVDAKKSEVCLLLAGLYWILMNSAWMWGDDLGKEWLVFVAKIYFLISLLLVIFALISSRKENEPIDFKRLKIK